MSNLRDDDIKPVTKEQFKELHGALMEKRERLLEQVREVSSRPDADELRMADEMDVASVGYDQAFEYRLRDREAVLLRKIDTALRRMEQGEYDECESCGMPIGFSRLKARLETTFCIDCKEEQEKIERMYEKRRKRMTAFEG